jgi:hypothetical protein
LNQHKIRVIAAACAVGIAAIAVEPAYAARPFVTDDARIVDAGGCQIETFYKRQQREGESEFWFLPGCTPAKVLDQTEFTVGGYKTNNSVLGSASTTIAQVKTLIRPLTTDGWGFAATVGAARQPQGLSPGSDSAWNPYINLVSSLSFAQDAMVVHVNAGALRDKGVERTLYSWGLGTEIALKGRLAGIAEAYNQEGETPSSQVGLRLWIIPDRWQMDATLGTQNASAARRTWTSLGVRLLF